MLVPGTLDHGEAVAEGDRVGHRREGCRRSEPGRPFVSCNAVRPFGGLRGFLRPYRRGAIWSVVLAGIAMLGTAAIPWLIGRVIDDIDAGDKSGLETLCALLVVAGLVRLVFSVWRRIVSGKVSLGVEYDLRNGLYGHLQALELGFFDRQQTGQLMSRATVDLQSIRFFLGYGFVWIAQSALTILFAAVAMFAKDPALAAISLAPVPFVVVVAFRYGRR